MPPIRAQRTAAVTSPQTPVAAAPTTSPGGVQVPWNRCSSAPESALKCTGTAAQVILEPVFKCAGIDVQVAPEYATCYDLDMLRSELRPFITSLGYEPVMSEYSDVLFDHRAHTHESCIKEVPGCDMVLLIVGSRFGGTALPSAVGSIDFSALQEASTKTETLRAQDKISITQMEVLKAIEKGIPVYAFVDNKVLHDHHLYERNKDKLGIVEQIDFPSIPKRETAKYIFEFINFLSHRTTNNSVIGFTRLEEIRLHLLSQWSQLFQRLLHESRTKAREAKRYADFSERIDDLKALVLASVAHSGIQATVRGALQFRHLIAFVSGLFGDHRTLLLSDKSWEELLEGAGVARVRTENRNMMRPEPFLQCADGSFFRVRLPRLTGISNDWKKFKELDITVRAAIVDALLNDQESNGLGGIVRHHAQNLDDYLSEQGRVQVETGGDAHDGVIIVHTASGSTG